MLFGAGVLTGAAVVPQALLAAIPDLGQTGLNTAASLLILGAALAWRGGGPAPRWHRRLPWLVVAVALPALFGLQLQSLLPAGVWSAWPGGMSPMSAAALLAAAMTLVMASRLQREAAMVAAIGLPLVVLAVALLSLFGHLIGLQAFTVAPGSGYLTSLPTALALLVLVAGLAGRLAGQPELLGYFADRPDRQIFTLNLFILFVVTVAAGFTGAGLMADQNMQAIRSMLVGTVRNDAAQIEIEVHRGADGIVAALREFDSAEALKLPAPRRTQAVAEWLDRLAREFPEAALVVEDEAGTVLAKVSRDATPPPELRLPLAEPAGAVLQWSDGWWIELPVPIVDAGRRLGTVRILVAAPRLNQLFAPNVELGHTGEIVVCGNDAEARVGCLASRTLPRLFQLPPRRDGRPWPAELAMTGLDGSVALLDRQQVPVVAGYSPIGDSGLALVRKINATEIYEPVRVRLLKASAAMLLMMAGGALVLHRRVQPVVRRLRYDQAQLSAILDRLPESVVMTDGQGVIETANRTTANLFGVEPDGLIGRRLETLVPDAVAPGTGVAETSGQRPDGSRFPLEVSAAAVEFDGRRHRVAVLRDISERDRTRAALERWAQIFEHAEWGVMVGSPDGTTLELMNPAFARMHGWTVAELSGRPLLEIFAPAVRPSVPEQIRIANYRGHHRFESLHLRRDGGVFPVMIDVTAVYDDDGDVAFRVANVQDISDLKAKELALKKSEELLRLSNSFLETVFAQAAVGVVVCNPDGRFLRVNRAFGDIVGYPEAELLRLSFREITHPDDLVAEIDQTRQMLAGAVRTYQMEKRLRHRDGSMVWVLLAVALVRDDSGAPLYVIGQIVDVSERKRIAEDLEESRRQLRRLSAHQEAVREQERKRIAHEVHDELGQLLTALKMEVNILRMKHGGDPAIAGKAVEMRELVEKTIGVVRHVARNLRPAALDLGLVPALEWLTDDFSRHSGVPCALTVSGDEMPLDDASTIVAFRVVQESLTNVARHAGAGNAEVTLAWSPAQVALAVRDDGVGFDPEAAADGFGLLGIRERIATVGGVCRIRSEPGHGTIVELAIPL